MPDIRGISIKKVFEHIFGAMGIKVNTVIVEKKENSYKIILDVEKNDD